MRVPKWSCRAAMLAVAAVGFICPAGAFADTYQVFEVWGSAQMLGIDASGRLGMHNAPSNCESPPNLPSACYAVVGTAIGQGVQFSATPPSLTYDNGTPCSPNVPGATVLLGVCNNGHEAYYALFDAAHGGRSGIFAGPDPLSDFVFAGPAVGMFMNSYGYIEWSNGNEIYEAVDLTSSVPEPGSMVLLATGLAGLAATVRRRVLSSLPRG